MSQEYDDEFGQFGDYDAKSAEARMAAGGMVPPGRYHAKLIAANRVESKQKQTPGWELGFEVTAGPFAGTVVTDTIYITENARSKDRLALFAHRLGVLEKKADGSGYVKAKGKVDFKDCMDTPCVIEVIHEPDQKDPNRKWLRLAFCGVFKPDDPELKKQPAAGKPAATAAGAGQAAAESAKKKFDKSKL